MPVWVRVLLDYFVSWRTRLSASLASGTDSSLSARIFSRHTAASESRITSGLRTTSTHRFAGRLASDLDASQGGNPFLEFFIRLLEAGFRFPLRSTSNPLLGLLPLEFLV